ncbi:MAG: hypothetical protein PUK83_05465 [Clostridia bacterium]|nr:hypothetical protein [Clostridia bacterium]MDY5264710.1 hypothetical protein [Eubacteriales bacterium]
MLTLNRERTNEEVRNRAFESKISERENSGYRTLDEDYDNAVRESRYARKEELWDRLNTTSPNSTTDERQYQSSSRMREMETDRLPYYTTDQPSTSMAIKKYQVSTPRKKTNVQGKIILAVYIMLIVLVATLVIVDSTMKTTAASGDVNAPQESEYAYVNVENTQETNWFDKVCDYISNAMGG